MTEMFCAATYACNNEMPLLATATGNAITVRTLNSEIPKTEIESAPNNERIVFENLKAKISTSISIVCVVLTCGSSGEMKQVQSTVEHFIAEAHKSQHIFLIVKAHDEIFIWIEKFMRCFSLHCGSVCAKRIRQI